jgi:hypothetical protein
MGLNDNRDHGRTFPHMLAARFAGAPQLVLTNYRTGNPAFVYTFFYPLGTGLPTLLGSVNVGLGGRFPYGFAVQPDR